MKQLSSRRRGIILVVTLLTSVVLLMFLGAALKLVPNQLNETVHSREKLAADTAARSGVAYALSRLQENAGWRASGTNEVVVNSPTLRVVEDLGNVVGYLRASDGSLSQFQIRFNYQNGASATGQWDDNFANPSQMLGIQCVSQNNLSGPAPKDVPTPTESIAIDASTTSSLKCARYSCLVQVVGMAGRGVSDAAPAARAQCVSSEAKAVFARSEMQKFDAVAYFGGGLEADLAGLDGADGLFSMDSVDARPSKIRALSNLEMNKGDINGKPSSEVVLQPGGQVTKPSSGPTAATTSAVRVTNESVTQQKDRWPRTKWSDIPQAKASDSHMPPGTYVWRYDSTQGYVIDHYAQDVVGTVAPTTAHTTYTETDFNATFPDAVRMDAAHLTLEFKDKLYVDTNASVNSLRVTYDDSVRLEGLRPLNYFASSGANKAILSSKGNITLDGVSRGKGSVTSEGDVQFQSSSIFEADPNSAVAIYAKGDVNLTPPSGVQTAAFNHYIQAAPAAATSSGSSGSQLSLASSVSLSLATTKFSFSSLANGFSLLVNSPTGGGGGPITNPGGGGGNVITFAPSTGYSINPPNVLYSAASMALFSNTATVPALSFTSTGVASTHLITSPFMLQALKIQPTFPLTSNDIGFSGLIYSEGNLNANVPDANLFINGVLCLWGGDSNSDPGSDNNKGRAHVKSLNALLNYDPSCLLNDSGNSTVLFPAKLDQTYFSLK
jgi:hypothetical protein